MWPDIAPLLQQLHSECSDKPWLVTGCQLDCPLASVGLGATRLQRFESIALLNLPFTERFTVAMMLINDDVQTALLHKSNLMCVEKAV